MKILAVGEYKLTPKGSSLPTYFIEASHHDLLMLGATNFAPGESLALIHHLDKAMQHLREAELTVNRAIQYKLPNKAGV